MEIKIRKANLADAQAIAGLLQGMGWFERMASLPVETVEKQVMEAIRLCLADHSHSIYIAEDEQGEICGYGSVHWLPYLFLPGPEGFVSELFVSKTARGQGVGARLLEAIKGEAGERGCYRLSLLNGRQRESYLRRFYEKQGWEERPGIANFVYCMPSGEDGPG